VCSCTYCNQRKANKTPEEAGMILIKQPTTPKLRKKDGILKVKFRYNPNKVSHKYYVEFFLMNKEDIDESTKQ
jgi:hypothetical protein